MPTKNQNQNHIELTPYLARQALDILSIAYDQEFEAQQEQDYFAMFDVVQCEKVMGALELQLRELDADGEAADD